MTTLNKSLGLNIPPAFGGSDVGLGCGNSRSITRGLDERWGVTGGVGAGINKGTYFGVAGCIILNQLSIIDLQNQ